MSFQVKKKACKTLARLGSLSGEAVHSDFHVTWQSTVVAGSPESPHPEPMMGGGESLTLEETLEGRGGWEVVR